MNSTETYMDGSSSAYYTKRSYSRGLMSIRNVSIYVKSHRSSIGDSQQILTPQILPIRQGNRAK